MGDIFIKYVLNLLPNTPQTNPDQNAQMPELSAL
jgi:hypothetical protein